MDQKQLIQTELTVSTGTVCKRSVLISTFNFPSVQLKNKTTQIYSLKVLPCVMLSRFRICTEKYPYIQVKFLTIKFIFVFCVTRSRVRKRNSEFNLGWMRLLATSYASRTYPDKNYVQIPKTAFHLGYITKLIVLYQAEQTDEFYTPSSV